MESPTLPDNTVVISSFVANMHVSTEYLQLQGFPQLIHFSWLGKGQPFLKVLVMPRLTP